MNKFEQLELVGICIIIGIQLYVFIKTKRRISIFKSIFPDAESFEIIKPGLRKSFFDLHPKELLLNINQYVEKSQPILVQTKIISPEGYTLRPEKYETDERIFIDLINIKAGGNKVTEKMMYALNTYLIRNRGVASDFYLIKDVIERNTDAVEDDIGQSISLPLYLGLLGTFLGIVSGLFLISGVDFATQPQALDDAIKLLLGGVKIAMIASFTGLCLTILHSGYFFKGAKVFVEDRKNDFYTFIQIDLLPLLNQNINSTLFSLQSNLHKFNEEFKTNVSSLSNVMGKNHDALVAQEKILTTLENMDVMEFAKANVKVLRELQISTEKFAEFNKYLGSVNMLVNDTKGYTAMLNEMIERTGNFHELGKQLTMIFSENRELTKFLQSHYDSLDVSHQLITRAVNNVGNTLDDSLVKLKEFTQERINEVQKITLKEVELMQEQYPEKWKKLDNLGYLESVAKNLSDMKMSNAAQIGSMSVELKLFSEKLSIVIKELESIKQNGKSAATNTFAGSIKNMFKKKKDLQMDNKKNDFFWPSYTDLMTSLFFIMLVLFVLVFTKQSRQIKDLQRQLAIVNAVDENLKPLKSDQSLFTYEEEYKRFKLSFDVKFFPDKSRIAASDLENYQATILNIDKAGRKLKSVIDGLKKSKDSNKKLKDVSYIVVIAGYASRTGIETHNYELSYQRALNLRMHWRISGIDFEAPEYNNLIDLQIAGNGWGGVGRQPNEADNQRFLIQIFPKIGDIK